MTVDFQALVERYGGYDKIPPEAWAAHIEALRELQARLRREHKPVNSSEK